MTSLISRKWARNRTQAQDSSPLGRLATVIARRARESTPATPEAFALSGMARVLAAPDAPQTEPSFPSPANARDLSGEIGSLDRANAKIVERKRGSLIGSETSLITDLNSLQDRKKFPVRMRRELAGKPLSQHPFLLTLTPRESPQSMKFSVNSLLGGNRASETSSLETASSSGESANHRFRCGVRRFWAGAAHRRQ